MYLGPRHLLALFQLPPVQGTLVPVQRHSLRLLAVQKPADAVAQHGHTEPQVLPGYSQEGHRRVLAGQLVLVSMLLQDLALPPLSVRIIGPDRRNCKGGK